MIEAEDEVALISEMLTRAEVHGLGAEVVWSALHNMRDGCEPVEAMLNAIVEWDV